MNCGPLAGPHERRQDSWPDPIIHSSLHAGSDSRSVSELYVERIDNALKVVIHV